MKKSVIFYPQKTGFNQYLHLQKQGFRDKGYQVFYFTKPDLSRRPFRKDLAVINWLENTLVNRHGEFHFKGFIAAILLIAKAKLFAKKQIYVRHNVFPHKTAPQAVVKVTKYANFLQSLFAIKASHSPALIEKGYDYIPHPLYTQQVEVSDKTQDYFLCFGSISKYKKIEELIEAWNFNEKLIVCGRSTDEKYAQHLIAQAEGKNIEIKPGFISDPEAETLVKNAKALMIPNNSPEVIISGSYFFALSHQKPVIAVTDDFYESIKNQLNPGNLILLESMADLNTGILNRVDATGITTSEFVKSLNFDWIDRY